MSAPRVCLLTETYYPVIGGGESQARALAEGLVARGWEVMVLTRRSDGGLSRREKIGEVDVLRLPPAGRQHVKKWGLLLAALPALIRWRGRYDLIFVSGFRIVGIAAVLAGRLLGKPVILKADSLGEMSGEFFTAGLARLGLRPNTPPFSWFLRWRNRLLSQAAAFVAISTTISRELAAVGVATVEDPSDPQQCRYRIISAARPGVPVGKAGRVGLAAGGQNRRLYRPARVL